VTIGPDLEMHESSQLEAAHGLQRPFPVRQNRREFAYRADPARAPAQTEIPFDPAPVLPAGQLASGDIPVRLPRPILWLAFAGWVLCCGMLFITLVQREPPAIPGRAWTATSSYQAGWSGGGGLAGHSEAPGPVGPPGAERTALSSLLKPVRAP
jgi:hypothetical protein